MTVEPTDVSIKARIEAFIKGQFEDAANAFNKHPSADNWALLEQCMWARQCMLSIDAPTLWRLWHDEPLGRYVRTLANMHREVAGLPPH